MISTDKSAYGRGKIVLSVDPVQWAEEKVRDYISKLEAEIERQDKEIQSLLWLLAASYQELEASVKLDKITDIVND